MSATEDALPVMGLWVRDIFASTRFAACHGHARGAYLELLLREFAARGAGLPAEDERLARLVALSLEEWMRVRAEVLQFFTVGADGRLRNERCEQEIARAVEDRAKARLKAQEAATARWAAQRAKERAAAARWPAEAEAPPAARGGQPEADAPSNARALPEQCHPHPHPKKDTPLPPAGGGVGVGGDFLEAGKALGFSWSKLRQLEREHPGLTAEDLRRWRELPGRRPDLMGNARSPPAYLRELVRVWGRVEVLEGSAGPSREALAAERDRKARERSAAILQEISAPREVASPEEIRAMAEAFRARREGRA